MKKRNLLFALMISITLSGCSFLGDVSETIDYVNLATDHVNNLSNFAEEAPQMIQNAVNDPAVKEKLETELVRLRGDIEEFIATNDIPSVAESIHQELVAKNEVLLEEINAVLENGNLALDRLENSDILQTANEVTGLMNRIENLGQ